MSEEHAAHPVPTAPPTPPASPAPSAPPVEPRGRRLSQDDRRRQLIGIGLQMLASRPIHALSIDAVAAEAGISRGLLFHYFPTKQHYYAAVVRAAARRLLNAAQADPHVDPAEQVRSIVAAYVGFIDRHLEPYVAFFHRGGGADADLQAIFDNVRDTLTERVLAASKVEAGAASRMTVRAWWALVESLAVDQATHHATTPAALVRYAVDVLVDLLARTDALASEGLSSGEGATLSPGSDAVPV